MEQLKEKAYAKINLSLDVVKRRDDGYHEVKMIMQTIGIYDEITIEKCEKGIYVTVSMGEDFKGESLSGDENNLVYKAAKLIMDSYGMKEGVKIHLEKRIPMAAGMAGGSTDAAAVFRGMNQLFALNMDAEQMKKMAVKIGADVPYCIEGGTMLSEGIGEILTPLKQAPDFKLLIAKPDISVSTKYVYENLDLQAVKKHPDVDGMVFAIENGDRDGILKRMENVLENVTLNQYPVIREIKTWMMENGAQNALMSGSGPTVFGIYKDQKSAEEAARLLRDKKLAKQIFTTTIAGYGKESAKADRKEVRDE